MWPAQHISSPGVEFIPYVTAENIGSKYDKADAKETDEY
jgi:hypothetical protein